MRGFYAVKENADAIERLVADYAEDGVVGIRVHDYDEGGVSFLLEQDRIGRDDEVKAIRSGLQKLLGMRVAVTPLRNVPGPLYWRVARGGVPISKFRDGDEGGVLAIIASDVSGGFGKPAPLPPPSAALVAHLDEVRAIAEEYAGKPKEGGFTALYLFGSASRGEDNDNSDFDFFLESELGMDGIHFTPWAMRRELEKLLRRPVDLLWDHDIRFYIFVSALRDRREIWRKPGTAVRDYIEEKEKYAKEGLAMGYTPYQVAEGTGLAEDEVVRLKAEMDGQAGE